MTDHPSRDQRSAPDRPSGARPARHRSNRGRIVLGFAVATGLLIAAGAVLLPSLGENARATGVNTGATAAHQHHEGMNMPGRSAGAPTTAPTGAAPAQKATPVRTFAAPPPRAQYHEIHADCPVTRHLSDDPIVYQDQPGASHNHTFIGNKATDAFSTSAKLVAGGGTSCQDPKDTSAYWFPTLYQNGKVVDPTQVTVYYKSAVTDYRTVVPFPAGFRLVVGDMHTPSAKEFKGNWRCGNVTSDTFPDKCPAGSSLVVRYQAPSCWDGVHLDTADHRSHMAYPVKSACPAAFPVPLPMLEIKVPYKLPGGNTAGLAYSSGASYSFHYDFMNGWQQARLAELVTHCINGGRQCNGLGVDQHKP